MAWTYEDCVPRILCGLNRAIQNALRQVIQIHLTQLNAYLVSLEAYLVYLNILTAPVNLLAGTINQILVEARGALNFLPINLVAQCADLGDIHESINEAINASLAGVERTKNELNRYLSLKDDVEAQITAIKRQLEVLTQINIILESCNDTNAEGQ